MVRDDGVMKVLDRGIAPSTCSTSARSREPRGPSRPLTAPSAWSTVVLMREIAVCLLLICAASCDRKPVDLRPDDDLRPSSALAGAVSASAPSSALATRAVPIPAPADRVLGCQDSTACAIDREGRVRCRGRNDFGQLGTGTRVQALVRSAIPVAGLGRARSLAVGLNHTCALTEAGEVWCWGASYDGQLGDGSPVPSSSAAGPTPSSPKPVLVKGLAGKVVAIDAGTLHTCAVLESGAVVCWGGNTNGQLGAPGSSSSTPASVPGVQNTAEVACGAELSCTRLRAGAVTCWGTVGTKMSGPTPVAGLCAKSLSQ
jgi:Regulator of chromosome condensation (RCC1) repeat